MKAFLLLATMIACSCANGKDIFYIGSTPAHHDLRRFLDIPLTDSVDFIKWQLVLHPDSYDLNCRFGIGKNGTNGFIDEKRRSFTGAWSKKDNYYSLHYAGKILDLLEINPNLLHLLDKNKALLVGNGGFSYTLNNTAPVKSDHFNAAPGSAPATPATVFLGRTPCQELSAMMGLNKSAACDKIKWYLVLYVDSVSHRPAYYLKGPRSYGKQAMYRGSWAITTGKNGRTLYVLDPGRKEAVYLLPAGDNILYFTDAAGNLLVGNEDFSYTLNRSHEKAP